MDFSFQPTVESWTHNRLEQPYDLKDKDMFFLRKRCEKCTHAEDDYLERVPIQFRNASMVRNLIDAMIYRHSVIMERVNKNTFISDYHAFYVEFIAETSLCH